MMDARWDVVVVGGGHAGCEAALAAARLGRPTLLLTSEPAALARMSCNPAIGGLAKGQVVCEIDALGGAMGLAADRTAIQFKVLNASRGPAVRGPRVQSDKELYVDEIRALVRGTPGLTVARGTATGFVEREGRLHALRTAEGETIRCRACVLTTGTFLGGLVHVGDERREEGRWGEAPAGPLAGSLRSLGLRLGRMKTGTPPRVHRDSIDFARMQGAPGDARPVPFSFRSRSEPFPRQRQVDCHLTHTTPEVHDLIRESLPLSPLYSGRIVGRGPRYCPSIEDKVVRFADRVRHPVFVEPEGLATVWTYLNGLSMSLPPAVQERVVRGIPGLERARFLRPAYAVEYDVVFPDQLADTLELRALPGLFLAGQINGTSGYEEAAGQGIVAGVNAALACEEGSRAPFVLSRAEAYIGVMIDDLVTMGIDEPYRLFTSRAEHRLLLGAESAWARLVPKAMGLGLVAPRLGEEILEREARIERALAAARNVRLQPSRETAAEGASLGIPISEETTLARLCRRPDIDGVRLFAWVGSGDEDLAHLKEDEIERAVTALRYDGLLERERETVARLGRSDDVRIPDSLRYSGLPGLSTEVVEKLERHRPRTVGQAGRIPGVTPSALAILLGRIRAGEGACAKS